MKKHRFKSDREATQAAFEYVFTAQALLLARQLRLEDSLQGKKLSRDYERRAVELIENARENIMFKFDYKIPD